MGNIRLYKTKILLPFRGAIVVQNRVFVVGGLCEQGCALRGRSVEYLNFLPPCLDTTSDGVNSEELSSTMMSWKVHGDHTLRDVECQEVVRVGSCLLFVDRRDRGGPFFDRRPSLVVLDTRRDQSWIFPCNFSCSSPMVALFDGIVSVVFPSLITSRSMSWRRLGLVDKHTLLFKRMLELSHMQIQSLVPGEF